MGARSLTDKHIVVIGAGVLGTSVAAGLARRGARVTLVDQDVPGSGTSSTSYGWVNSNGKEPRSYFDLNLAGLEAHHALAARGEAPWLVAGGHVEIAVDEAHVRHLRARVETLEQRGYAVEQVGAERAAELLPDVRVPDDASLIAYFPREAHAHPMLLVADMLDIARRAGARLVTGAKVVALEQSGAGATVRLADGSELAADTVVSAVGRWTAQLTGMAGVRVPMAEFASPGDVTVGYLVETSPVPARLGRLVTSPWLNIRPEGGGRLLLQALDLDVTADPADVPAADSSLAKQFLERLQDVVPGAGGAQVRRIVVGQRALPADGLTVAGRVPGLPWLYTVATHSGVTLAPFLGEAVAGEVLGDQDRRLADFRPDRLLHDAAIPRPKSPRKPGEQ